MSQPVTQPASSATPIQLLKMTLGIVVQQALYAAAKLGVADLIDKDGREVSNLAGLLKVNTPALLRLLRFLASQGVFEERTPGVFSHTELSQFLRT